jgi:RNA polymerase primary sigma factor
VSVNNVLDTVLASSSVAELSRVSATLSTGVGDYIDMISKYRALTLEEEVLLKQLIEKGVTAKAALAHLRQESERRFRVEERVQKSFAEIENKLLSIAKRGEVAFSMFVLSNLKLVVWAAKRFYVPEGMAFMDMVQDGNLGLLRGIEKWDWRKGVKFSSYGLFWIRQSIRRGLEFSRQIRLPKDVQNLLAKLRTARTEFFLQNSRSPTPEELTERLGISMEKYAAIADYLNDPLSLDAPSRSRSRIDSSHQNARSTLLDGIQTRDEHDITEGALREQVKDLLERLEPRDAFILTKRFGLDGEAPCSQRQVASLLGISATRVREIELRALARLRVKASEGETREALLGHVDSSQPESGGELAARRS